MESNHFELSDVIVFITFSISININLLINATYSMYKYTGYHICLIN